MYKGWIEVSLKNENFENNFDEWLELFLKARYKLLYSEGE